MLILENLESMNMDICVYLYVHSDDLSGYLSAKWKSEHNSELES